MYTILKVSPTRTMFLSSIVGRLEDRLQDLNGHRFSSHVAHISRFSRLGSQSPWSRDRAEMCPVSKMSLAQTHTVRGMTSRACVFCTHIPTT